ncbi:acetylornithine and succinylornithine aminotransferase [Irpex lacteus]|nr:acetylornithine and succinylornithine aminotransferase [Irpex lacteus]
MSAQPIARLAQRAVTRRPKRLVQCRQISSTARLSNSSPSTRYTAVSHPTPSTPSTSAAPFIEKANAYTLPVYARPNFVLSHGKGVWVWDTDGNKYLDFCAGIAVNALGHADEEFVKVMSTEAGKLLHSSNLFHHQWSGKLAELLVTLTQRDGGLGWEAGSSFASSPGAKIFFANSGTEANEGALKIARKVGKERWARKNGKAWDDAGSDKFEIVAFENAFHGRSMGALSVTSNPKYQKPFAPLIPGVKVGKLNVVEEVEKLVTEKTCAVILEPIQGEGGIFAASEEFLRALRKRCDETGAVLIYDEVQCGLYRTGKIWAHSAFPSDCHPDVVTMAKPLANGFPIGAVLMRDNIAEVMTVGTHGTTFGGSPLACALGFHVLSRVSEPSFAAKAAETSSYLHSRLSQLPTWFPEILEPRVRGRGFILGLGLRNKEHPAKLVGMARERGVLLLTAGSDAVRIIPSLTISREEVDVAVDVLESCLGLLRA